MTEPEASRPSRPRRRIVEMPPGSENRNIAAGVLAIVAGLLPSILAIFLTTAFGWIGLLPLLLGLLLIAVGAALIAAAVRQKRADDRDRPPS